MSVLMNLYLWSVHWCKYKLHHHNVYSNNFIVDDHQVEPGCENKYGSKFVLILCLVCIIQVFITYQATFDGLMDLC